MSNARWFGRLLRHWSAEMLGFSPLIALYLTVAFCGGCFDQYERDWLIIFQFLIFEVFACLFTAATAFKLGDGFELGKGHGRRLLSPGERDAVLLLLGFVLVGLMPGALFAWMREPARAVGMAILFLPRMLELWRVREQPKPVARALGYSALSGPLFLLGLATLLLLLGAGSEAGSSVGVTSGARFGGVLVATYYVVVATFTAWMRVRVEAWQT